MDHLDRGYRPVDGPYLVPAWARTARWTYLGGAGTLGHRRQHDCPAGAQFLGRRACLLIGAGIVLGHDLLDSFWPSSDLFGVGSSLWVALHAQMSSVIGSFQIAFVYPLRPWIGLMLLGFGAAGLEPNSS